MSAPWPALLSIKVPETLKHLPQVSIFRGRSNGMAPNCYDVGFAFPTMQQTTDAIGASSHTSAIVIGGGIIGLSIALELHWRGLSVRVLTKDSRAAAAQAAAGMLAPQAEEIPPGAMLELCLWSRNLYPDWTAKIAALTGLNPGYWPCGILAPRQHQATHPNWQDRSDLLQQLGSTALGPTVAGGYWFPADGQVDNRALYAALQAAVQLAEIEVIEGVAIGNLAGSQFINSLETDRGIFQADRYILATGAWSQELLPVPVQPRKGQMLALQVPATEPLPLKTVLFAEDVYIVPRRDGRIIVGATSEDVGFRPHNTESGIQGLQERAVRLCPMLDRYPIAEQWWGFRPSTPDELPILGPGPQSNLILATGHYRNGILLAPATAHIIADLICQQPTPLLSSFSYQRFLASPSLAIA
jgi:glycine oxidase ThiO